MRILALDDVKERHDAFRAWHERDEVRSVYYYRDFLIAIEEGPWDLVYLDHDLGDEVEGADTFVDGWGKTREYDGTHAALRLCEQTAKGKFSGRVIIVSHNKDGAKSMRTDLQRSGIDVVWEPFGELTTPEAMVFWEDPS